MNLHLKQRTLSRLRSKARKYVFDGTCIVPNQFMGTLTDDARAILDRDFINYDGPDHRVEAPAYQPVGDNPFKDPGFERFVQEVWTVVRTVIQAFFIAIICGTIAYGIAQFGKRLTHEPTHQTPGRLPSSATQEGKVVE